MEKTHTYLIQRTLDYIDDNIEEKIEAEELAKLSGFSLYYYYKIFNKYMGTSVMDYVTKRKLQYALYDLAKGDKILDIALRYGFETHAGFTKAFKKIFGYPPNFYRIHAPIDYPKKIILENILKNKTGGMIIQPKILEREKFKIIGYEFKTTLKDKAHSRDIPAFWDKCNIEGKEKRLYKTQNPIKHGEYGICVKNSIEEDEFSYILGIEVNNFNKMLEDMSKIEVPSAKYAVFTTPRVNEIHFTKSIKGTWKYILEEWFPNSSYEVDDGNFDFEFYDERSHPWENDKLSMDIYIPILLKKEEKLDSY
ncbi:AraC family transcriptional regulator [Acetoanaerobium pronyense]|uniref:AraC family transcriptional regulator n=1 Tax=Acetoanaerobium pronyense TaxID=1482736 RepID=A0ABS4KJ87_9FIRM|nr:AraC family transcriptional regulator [Acetoanaerobium pronyense]MBP2027851.1 AraC family transcriptional regulator [Acetoanaerobium pronyense]